MSMAPIMYVPSMRWAGSCWNIRRLRFIPRVRMASFHARSTAADLRSFCFCFRRWAAVCAAVFGSLRWVGVGLVVIIALGFCGFMLWVPFSFVVLPGGGGVRFFVGFYPGVAEFVPCLLGGVPYFPALRTECGGSLSLCLCASARWAFLVVCIHIFLIFRALRVPRGTSFFPYFYCKITQKS